MQWIANLFYLLASVLYLPVLGYQMLVQGKNRRGWRERFGWLRLGKATKPRIWVHAVSLGEVNATRLLVERLAAACPDYDIVISSTTDTGYTRACALYGAERTFRYPLDFSWVVKRVLDRVSPALIILMELEVWWNLTAIAHRRGIPIGVANGRITERSARRLAGLGNVARAMFSRLDWVGAQDEVIASRFKQLGTANDHVHLVGSLKWDTADSNVSIDDAGKLASALGLNEEERPVWVCGSTGPGEEAIILDAYSALMSRQCQVVLVIVPRKPERFDSVAELISSRSLECVRRSACAHGTSNTGQRLESYVILGDTMGELRMFYSLSTVVFVGRSLVSMGGSDPMEVAALGKPIIAGPHLENFEVASGALKERGALMTVGTADELADAVEQIVSDACGAANRGEAARLVVTEHQGATDVTVEGLRGLLERL